ncbi:response regulator [Luteibacter aegosomatissinici]|uniref:response regulator n=1 Tax=Luteibacter aegosomatissinici TaxID=2911539 RepID=UPI001FFBCCBE|nr:response regulator [Luteibacter aegosomatissinici]UPG96294.1 response regulator [Luteibacter aegosomatissinici]
MEILVVEDDVLLGKAIVRALEQLGHGVTWERDGARALARLRTRKDDVALIDLGLPDIDGIDVIRAARSEQLTVPVIIMTARDDIRSKVTGLDAGADDYLSKPFHLDELGARIRSVARRTREAVDHVIEVGTIRMNLDSFEVLVAGKRVDFTPREFTLLHTLAARAGRIVHRDILDSLVYGRDSEVSPNALEVLIHAVRRKVGPDNIRTIRGMGYLLPSPADR